MGLAFDVGSDVASIPYFGCAYLTIMARMVNHSLGNQGPGFPQFSTVCLATNFYSAYRIYYHAILDVPARVFVPCS